MLLRIGPIRTGMMALKEMENIRINIGKKRVTHNKWPFRNKLVKVDD
jgi:hypothetical protein